MSKPLLRGYFHQSMFFISVGALMMLFNQTRSLKELISILIYSIGVLAMFGISALYHRINWSDEKRQLMRKLDHSAIYLMISGSMTPIAVMGLKTESMQVLLSTIWAVALFGIIKSIWFTNLPKFLNAVLCLIAGYLIVPYFNELTSKIGMINVILICVGGLFYSVGALIYGLKKPNPYPKVFGYHEIFHILVSLGAIMHFIIVQSLIG
jgi:hemolysin III